MTPLRDIPVVSIVGKGDSGKTTFLEKLIRELVTRGYGVATVKHHVHDYDIDTPGKDSWRHARAGAVTTMVSSPAKFSMVTAVERELTLPELARLAADSGCDILLTEGYKREGVNRIEVSRRARSEELVCAAGEALALVTDNAEVASGRASVFALDDADGVADLIVARFLTPPGAEGLEVDKHGD
ncbi:MAG: molybdopterin-guanine dinucleotide biosynthesis protein B [Coriobacteriia bacterium]|nr:molybdopterin-guanine dinucleotide biosynthesis protein B [Coriobacteriia bacterium]